DECINKSADRSAYRGCANYGHSISTLGLFRSDYPYCSGNRPWCSVCRASSYRYEFYSITGVSAWGRIWTAMDRVDFYSLDSGNYGISTIRNCRCGLASIHAGHIRLLCTRRPAYLGWCAKLCANAAFRNRGLNLADYCWKLASQDDIFSYAASDVEGAGTNLCKSRPFIKPYGTSICHISTQPHPLPVSRAVLVEQEGPHVS